MRFRSVITGGAIAAFGLASIGGYALGATRTQVIHACYENKAPHTLIKATKCPRGYKTLEWNVTGPRGARGPAGTPGTPGGPGPSTAGTSGLDVTEVGGTLVNATTTGDYNVNAACPAAEPYVVGGGFNAADGEPTSVVSDEPFSGDYPGVWHVMLDMPSGSSAIAYALCSK